MSTRVTIGFPRMLEEAGEKRVFLPKFIHFLAHQGGCIFIEEGYGSRSSFTFDDYQRGSKSIHKCSRIEAFQQEFVVILRSPHLEEFDMMRKGACIISMLHFPTRPYRVERLKELGLNAISMDCIVNDQNIRLVENMKAVAWNGLDVAFSALEKRMKNLVRSDGTPIHVLIIGSGLVGKHAVDAATKLGNIERNNKHIQVGGPGSVAIAAGRNVTYQPVLMKRLLQQTDILVDAAQRRDQSKPIIPNDWISWMPKHAVIADLSVDPYILDSTPPVVRGIEGIPQGNLDQFIFEPDDPNWENTIPDSITTENRRTSITCYSWPGIHSEACMMHYTSQLQPLMQVLLAKGYASLSPQDDYYEKALCRAALTNW